MIWVWGICSARLWTHLASVSRHAVQAQAAQRVHFKGDTKGDASSGDSDGEQAPGSEASFSTGGKPRRKLAVKIKDSAEVARHPADLLPG